LKRRKGLMIFDRVKGRTEERGIHQWGAGAGGASRTRAAVKLELKADL